MDPASAAPAAGSAGIPAAPRTPASSPPSAGRSRIVAPPPAGSALPHTPLAAPARTVPRLSSLRPLPILAEDLLLPDFRSGSAGLPGRSMRDYLSGALSCEPRARQDCARGPRRRALAVDWKPQVSQSPERHSVRVPLTESQSELRWQIWSLSNFAPLSRGCFWIFSQIPTLPPRTIAARLRPSWI